MHRSSPTSRTADELGQAHPGRGWLPAVHWLLSLPVIFGGFFAGALGGDALASEPGSYGAGMMIVVAVCTLYSGLLELISGVSPCYGPICKHTSRHRFAVGPGVRRLGGIRVAIAAGIVAILLACAGRQAHATTYFPVPRPRLQPTDATPTPPSGSIVSPTGV